MCCFDLLLSSFHAILEQLVQEFSADDSVPDSNKKLKPSQLEQRSNMGKATVFYPATPNMSIKSDDEE